MVHLLSAATSLRHEGLSVLPMIGWPDPRDWARDILEAGLEWLVEQFGKSAEAVLQDTVDTLKQVKWPGFDEGWYEYLVGNMFGLTFTLLTLTIMLMGFVGMFAQRWIPEAGRAFGVTMLLFAFNQGMYMFIVTLDKLSESLTLWAEDFASGGGDNPDWTKDIVQMDDLTDVFSSVFAYWASFILGWILKIEAYVLVYLPYAGMIVLVFSFVMWAWSRRARGGKLIRWTIALLTTSILGKPLMMATLGLGALVSRNLPADPVWVIIFHVLAAAVPLLVFWLANQAYSSVLDGHLRVEVDNDIDINDMPSPEPESLQAELDDSHDLSVKLDDMPGTGPSSSESGSGGLAAMLTALGDDKDELMIDAVASAAKAAAVAEGQVYLVPVIDMASDRAKEKRAESAQDEEEVS